MLWSVAKFRLLDMETQQLMQSGDSEDPICSFTDAGSGRESGTPMEQEVAVHSIECECGVQVCGASLL